MAATTGSSQVRATEPYDDDRGAGWVAFAGIMISVVGLLNIIYGIAAISNSKFYFREATYIIHNLNVYGWVTLIVGVVQVAAAFAIFGRAPWARWVGIFTAGLNLLVQLVWIATYPLASLAIISIDVLVIYALVTYGKRSQAAF
jgi:hypothetical protein